MTEDKGSTSVEHLKGSVKEALGKLTGDAEIEAAGRRQKRDARTAVTNEPRRANPNRD